MIMIKDDRQLKYCVTRSICQQNCRQTNPLAMRAILLSGLWCLLLVTAPAYALYITDDLEILRIPNAGYAWTSVSTQNSYTSPVIVCTYTLPSDSDNESVVRIRNAGPSGFQLRIQRPENRSSVTASAVYCLVADDGHYTMPSPDNRVFEAHTATSYGTNGNKRGWGVGANGAENVSGDIDGTYPATSHPVVLGQVMSYNDAEFSAFWSFDCDDRRNYPFQTNLADGICIGKHVGQINGTSGDRANETLGYIVIEEGTATGSYGGILYWVALGGDSVKGVGNSPPYTYGVADHYSFVVATQEAMDGGNGSWAVLYGNNPLAGTDLHLAVDEETVAGDTTREHTKEQVAYWAFKGTDHGDAPFSYGDASHIITGLLSIGASSSGDADAETAQYSNAADADDTTTGTDAGIDDEDGVTFSSPAGGGDIVATVTVTNNTGNTVTLCGWMDVDRSGSFDSGERQCSNGSNPNANFHWTVSDTDNQQNYYSRFRVCSSTSQCDSPASTVSADDGEVEDYRITYNPTAVTIGKVELKVTRIPVYLEELGIKQMNESTLRALLQAWDASADAALSADADREKILVALKHYLDPDGDGQLAVFSWNTLEERGTIGFYVDRRHEEDVWTRINDDMLPGLINAPMGGEYRLADPGAVSGSYRYRLIEQEARGTTRSYGPFDVKLP